MTPSEYIELRGMIPLCFRDLINGPRRVGGFRRKVIEIPVVSEGNATDLRSGMPQDEVDAANRIAELLTHAELERLVGKKLIASYRALWRSISGGVASLSKEALGAILVLRAGDDLLADGDLRSLLSKKCGVENLQRWHSGKASAIEFVSRIGLPERFAGSVREKAPDGVEWLSGRIELSPLEDFQEEVLSTAYDQLRRDRRPRTVITLPTGAGKTRTAVEYVRRVLGSDLRSKTSTVIWVAHTSELLEQAIEAFRQVWSQATDVPQLRIERRFGGGSHESERDAETLSAGSTEYQIIVTTPQTALNDIRRWRDLFPDQYAQWLESLELIVIDEAHRAAAPQYESLLNELAGEYKPRVLGLTATPFRHEYINDPELGTKKLYLVFRQIAAPNKTLGQEPREVLQQRQILATPIEHRIETGKFFAISPLLGKKTLPLDQDDIDAVDRELRDLADEADRRAKVFSSLRPIADDPDSRVLYFGPTVHDAEAIAVMLRAIGVSAAFVSGHTRGPQRRKLVQQFRNGEIKVLCNCEVLTTGFDAPLVTHVVIARPTVSHVLFEQMVGRGLRGPRFGGTKECNVTYFVDRLDVPGVALGYRGWRKIWGLDSPENTAS
jgi:superfamily II DNA or RNA helicase